MDATPLISVLTPVYRPDDDHFRACIQSVVDQDYDDWELILVLDGPQAASTEAIVAEFGDPRVRAFALEENAGIVGASSVALGEARGTFIALLDNDDTLASFALGAVAEAIEEWPGTDVVYSDEDKLALDGTRDEPFCKPGFSPERLRCQMYLGHLGVYRRDLVIEVGGFRAGFDGSQDHDLALRVTERARRVVHIPRILYHWRRSATSTAASPEAKDWAFEAGVRVVQSHLERMGIPATAYRDHDHPGVIRLEPTSTASPLVSIIVPTGGGYRIVAGARTRLIDQCIASILERTTYADYEVVVVLDSNASEDLAASIGAVDRRVRVVRNARPFNFAEACNFGRDNARGEHLVFLNDDTEVVTTGWLQRLVLFADIDGVGAVGAKLLYSDGRIQHAGLVCRDRGVVHRSVGLPGDHRGMFESHAVQANFSAVTGACLAIRTDRFDRVGGFAAVFPLAFNDVDLCFKLLRVGLRTVYDPETVLIHHESSTRNPAVTLAEVDLLMLRWRDLLDHDPYDNPNIEMPMIAQLQPSASLMELRERHGDVPPNRAWPPASVEV